jgi:hypothetical protein
MTYTIGPPHALALTVADSQAAQKTRKNRNADTQGTG